MAFNSNDLFTRFEMVPLIEEGHDFSTLANILSAPCVFLIFKFVIIFCTYFYSSGLKENF